MKKILTQIMASILVLGTCTCAYASDNVEISKVSAKNGIVSVEVQKPGAKALMMTLVKEDDGIDVLKDKVYYFTQLDFESEQSDVTFEVTIPDLKDGIPGSGKYTVVVKNYAGESDELTFDYADSYDVGEFLTAVEEADKKVTSDEDVVTYLLPLVEAEESKGVLFSMGIELDNFLGDEAKALRQEMMRLLHYDGLQDLSVTDFAQKFESCYGLALYNTGSRSDAVHVILPMYGESQLKQAYVDEAIKIMNSSYETVESIKTDSEIAYGIACITNAGTNNMEDVLKTFTAVTGECSEIISKINSDSVKKYTAHEFIINECDKSVPKGITELEDLLDDAYDSAYKSTGTSGSPTKGGKDRGSVLNSNNISDTNLPFTWDNSTLFKDISQNHWARESIANLKAKGIVNGTDTGMFEPDRNITREEFTKMIILICGLDGAADAASFSDVNPGAWYMTYINAAVESGIVTGIGDDKFGIGQNITRQDMAVMVQRALSAKGIAHETVKAYTDFDDEDSIAAYAKTAVKMLYEAGVVNGKDGNFFDPTGNATRAEAAKIIYEAFEGGK